MLHPSPAVTQYIVLAFFHRVIKSKLSLKLSLAFLKQSPRPPVYPGKEDERSPRRQKSVHPFPLAASLNARSLSYFTTTSSSPEGAVPCPSLWYTLTSKATEAPPNKDGEVQPSPPTFSFSWVWKGRRRRNPTWRKV